MKYNVPIIGLLIALLYCSCRTEQPESETISLMKEAYPSGKMMITSPITIDSFTDTNVRTYLQSYEMYIEAYREFVKSRDMRLLDSLNKIGGELTMQITTVTEELSEDEIQKLDAFMNVKAAELQELSRALEE